MNKKNKWIKCFKVIKITEKILVFIGSIILMVLNMRTYIEAKKYSKYDVVIGEVVDASDAEITLKREEENKKEINKEASFVQTIEFRYKHNGKVYFVVDEDREISSCEIKNDVIYSDRYYEKGDEIELYVKDDKWMEVAKVKRDSSKEALVMCVPVIIIVVIFFKKKKNKSKC